LSPPFPLGRLVGQAESRYKGTIQRALRHAGNWKSRECAAHVAAGIARLQTARKNHVERCA